VPEKPTRKSYSDPIQIPYKIDFDPRTVEEGSDVYALHIEHKVSVTPLSLDLSSRADFTALEKTLAACDR
jgi:broad specificity polyphosphatase/5'/3'-nucleotidase SurE